MSFLSPPFLVQLGGGNSVSEVQAINKKKCVHAHRHCHGLDDRRERRSIEAQHPLVAWERSASAVR